MAYVRTIPPTKAAGELLTTYQKIARTERPEYVPPVIEVSSIRPRILDALWELGEAVRNKNYDSGLTLVQREMIATVVSATLECRY